MNDRLEERVRSRMATLEHDRLLRRLRAPAGIDLSSNDYLGLADHARVKAAMSEAIAREGVGSTGSRLLRGERDCFTAIEARFAEFKSTGRSLYLSSGYLANIAVITAFAEQDDLIVSDERNHASLVDGIRLSPARRKIVPHNDIGAVRQALHTAGSAGERFLLVESLFSMDGDEAPLEDYADLCASTGAHLIVDEAHAVGVYGRRGSGLVEERCIGDRVFVSVNTAGKALGVNGAFVAGPAWAIDYMIQRARPFVFSTAPPPALAFALAASLDVIAEEPERRAVLRDRTAALRTRLAEAGIPQGPGSSHIVPVLIGDNEDAVLVSEVLQGDGFDVRAIRPPSVPAGTARLRISVNVRLTDEVIDRFVAALTAALHKVACTTGSS